MCRTDGEFRQVQRLDRLFGIGVLQDIVNRMKIAKDGSFEVEMHSLAKKKKPTALLEQELPHILIYWFKQSQPRQCNHYAGEFDHLCNAIVTFSFWQGRSKAATRLLA